MNVVDALVVSIGLDASDLKKGAAEATAAQAKLTTDLVSTAEKGEKAQTGALGLIVRGWNNLMVTQRKAADASVSVGKTMVAAHTQTAQSIESVIRSAGAMLLLFAGASSLKSFTTNMIALDAAVGRVAHNTGSTAESISGIGRAAERVGGTFDGAVGGVRGFVDAFEQLRTTGQSGIMEPLARLQALGGKPVTLGRDWHKSLMQIADDLQALDKKDPALADYLGRQIVGDEGLVNLLKQGSGAFEQQERASKVTAQQAKDAQALQTQLVAVRQGFQDIGNSILMDFGPAMISGLKWIKDLVSANRGLIETKVKEWIKDVGDWFRDHKTDIEAFGTAVGELATAAGGVAKAFTSQSPMMQALEAFTLLLGGRALTAIKGIGTAMTALGSIPAPAWALAAMGLSAVAQWEGAKDAAKILGSDDPAKNDVVVDPESGMATKVGPSEGNQGTGPNTGFNRQSGFIPWFKRLIGLGDADSKPKEDLSDIAKATGETRDILKAQKDGAGAFGSAGSGLSSTGGSYGGGGSSLSDRARHGSHGYGGTAPNAAKGADGVPYDAKSATAALGISQKEWDAFREGVSDIEGKSYKPGLTGMGGAGGRYAGRYQMGPSEITDTAKRLGVPRPSNEEFVNDPAMQERFFENYTIDHYRTLMRNPKFAALSHREQLKILGYAHNQGTGGPTHENGAWGYLDRGAVGHDAFGTAGTAYFATIGRRLDAIDKAVPATPPSAAPAVTPTAASPSPLGTPEKAITDAEVFAARQRIINGSRDPKDHDIVTRYLREQNTPPADKAGPAVGNFDPRLRPVVPQRPSWESADGRGRPIPSWQSKDGTADGIATNDMRDPRFAPKPVPVHPDDDRASRSRASDAPHGVTVEHAVRQILRAAHQAQRLQAHNDNHPVPVDVTDHSAKRIGERTFGAYLGFARKHEGEMPHATPPWQHHAAAYGRMMRVAEAGRYASYPTHNVDRSVTSDTTVNGGIHVHTQATDARGIVADIEPHLRRGQAAVKGDYGYA